MGNSLLEDTLAYAQVVAAIAKAKEAAGFPLTRYGVLKEATFLLIQARPGIHHRRIREIEGFCREYGASDKLLSRALKELDEKEHRITRKRAPGRGGPLALQAAYSGAALWRVKRERDGTLSAVWISGPPRLESDAITMGFSHLSRYFVLWALDQRTEGRLQKTLAGGPQYLRMLNPMMAEAFDYVASKLVPLIEKDPEEFLAAWFRTKDDRLEGGLQDVEKIARRMLATQR